MENTQLGETKYLGEEVGENDSIHRFAQWGPKGSPIQDVAEKMMSEFLGKPVVVSSLHSATVWGFNYSVVSEEIEVAILTVVFDEKDYQDSGTTPDKNEEELE